MRFHLVTVEETQRFDDMWTIAPLERLRSLSERAPGITMPLAGDEVELHLPDGRVMIAHIVTFGVSAWKDSEGNFYINSDPSDPSLTLTIRCDSHLTELPRGTEIWLRNARTSAASEDT